MKIIIIVTLTVLSFFIAGYTLSNSVTKSFSNMIDSQQYLNNQVDNPSKLIIPKLNITADIEAVGLNSKNEMDVPKNVWNVAWYKLGSKPAEVGNSVIAGHLDSETGPAIFYYLNDLTIGDEIEIIAENGKRYYFHVFDKKIYPNEKFPIDEVFGHTKNHNLNLITCTGDYNNDTRSYSDRIVIYAKLK